MSLPRDGQQVRARAQEGRFGLRPADDVEQALPPARVVPVRVEVLQQPGRPFDGENLPVGQAGVGELLPELVRVVEERGGEVGGVVVRVSVLPVGEVAGDDGGKRRVVQVAGPEPVQGRGEAGDGGGDEYAAGPEHPPGLGQGRQAVGAVGQVVERPEQEDRVGAVVGAAQRPRVPDGAAGEWVRRLGPGGLLRLGNVQRHGVVQVHLVAQGGEPAGVDAGAPADVGDDRGRRRQEAPEDLLRPGELKPPGALGQTARLEARRVVGFDLRLE